jgi:hypothetical protein
VPKIAFLPFLTPFQNEKMTINREKLKDQPLAFLSFFATFSKG